MNSGGGAGSSWERTGAATCKNGEGRINAEWSEETTHGGDVSRRPGTLLVFALLRNGSETGLGICVFWILGGYFVSDRMHLVG